MKPASTHKQLTEYIKKNLSKGYTPESLKYALLNQGYDRISISRAMEFARKQISEESPKITHTFYTTKEAGRYTAPIKPSLFQKLRRVFQR